MAVLQFQEPLKEAGTVDVLPLHPELITTFKMLCRDKLSEASLFTLGDGREYTGDRLYKITAKAIKSVGIKTYARHTSFKTTERYLKLNTLSLAGIQTIASGSVVPLRGDSEGEKTGEREN